MFVAVAHESDIAGWLALAADVEPIFGCPLVDDPHFNSALRSCIRSGSAYCVREGGGPPGSPLLGGLLFSTTDRPAYRIGWLGVFSNARRQGTGEALVRHVVQLVERPADLVVDTFVAGASGGEPARRFYAKLGFEAGEVLEGKGPNNGPVQVFRLHLL